MEQYAGGACRVFAAAGFAILHVDETLGCISETETTAEWGLPPRAFHSSRQATTPRERSPLILPVIGGEAKLYRRGV